MEARLKKSFFIWWVGVLVVIIIAIAFPGDNAQADIGLAIIAGLAFIYLGISLMVKKPVITISEQGVSVRPYYLAFASSQLIEWNSISSFEHAVVENSENDSNTQYLIIEQKGKRDVKKINISILDIEPDQILAEMRLYSLKFSINECRP